MLLFCLNIGINSLFLGDGHNNPSALNMIFRSSQPREVCFMLL